MQKGKKPASGRKAPEPVKPVPGPPAAPTREARQAGGAVRSRGRASRRARADAHGPRTTARRGPGARPAAADRHVGHRMKRWASWSTPVSWILSSRRPRSRRRRWSNRWSDPPGGRLSNAGTSAGATELGETPPGEAVPGSRSLRRPTSIRPRHTGPAVSAAPPPQSKTTRTNRAADLRLRIEEQRPRMTPPLPLIPNPRMVQSVPSPSAGAPGGAKPGLAPRVRLKQAHRGCSRPAAPGQLARPAAPASARPPYPGTAGPSVRPLAVRDRCRRTRFARHNLRGGAAPGSVSAAPRHAAASAVQPSGGGARSSAGPRRDVRPVAPNAPVAPPPVTRTITLAEGMTVKDLADKLDLRVKDVLAKLLMKRLMMTINSTLDTDTATMLAREFGADVQMRSFEEELIQIDAGEANAADIVTRAPVVTVMGHVDHGKTSLLDAIREARVAEREAGGITQHIGAYHVTINNRNIVFLDTPGHEAFTLMRARGAKVTDIVVLVVAADDGVMPQTREAIDHAKAANVPIIVAINKIDKPNASPERVKREMTELGLMPEEWGGKTVTVEVSAKKKQNLELLLEMILLVTDIGELKANPKKHATGTVLESKLDKGRGPVATVLVQDGTLHVGDTFIAGPIVGRVRALIDDRGRPTKAAGPSTPVEVLGLTGLPQPGDVFQVADATKARQIAAFREEQAKSRALGAKGAA